MTTTTTRKLHELMGRVIRRSDWPNPHYEAMRDSLCRGYLPEHNPPRGLENRPMTTLYMPLGESIELEEADIYRLAFEYRNCQDQATLDAIAAECSRRDVQFVRLIESAQARGQSVGDGPHTDTLRRLSDAAELRRLVVVLREALEWSRNYIQNNGGNNAQTFQTLQIVDAALKQADH